MKVTMNYSDNNPVPPIKKKTWFETDASNESKAFLRAVEVLNEMAMELYELETGFQMFTPGGFNQIRDNKFPGKVFRYFRNDIEILIVID